MKKCLLLMALILSLNCAAQFSKTHYIPPLSSSVDVLPEDQYLYISTPSLTPVNFRIINLGGGIEEGTVSRDAPYIADLGFGDDTQLIVSQSLVNQVLSNKGYIVEAEDLIYVSARIVAGNSNQAGEVVSKGLAALGTQFRIGAFANTLVPNYGTVHYTFVAILATENNTHVNFSDIATDVQLVNNTAAGNMPEEITLNSGESFVMAVAGPNNANRDGLIGSLVSSDKPIAVNCGSFGGSNGELNNLDLGFDQIVSAERTGKDYIFIRGTGQTPVERILLIAHEDNTQIFLNGNTTPVSTIDSGQYMSFDGSSFNANGNLYVSTSKNIFAYQSIGDDGRPDQANQEMFFVPPLSCETPKIIDNIPDMDRIGTREFNGRVTIVTETGSSLDFIIDGTDYTLSSLPNNINVNGPENVTGNANYVTYILTGLSGNVSVYSTGQLYLASYGSSDAATFGGFYSGFTFKPEVAFDRVDLTQSNCIPNVALSVSQLTAFDVFQWYFNDVAIAGATARDFTPTQPGYYHVSATIAACDTMLISDKIPVSSCPDDLDNDQANNNIDLDNDNDGIQNCSESLGDLAIDLTDPLSGTISVGTYSNSFAGSFPIAEGEQAPVPFSSSASGSFVTEVTAGKGHSVIYAMNFAQPVSISLEYPQTANASDLITSNSEFIISVPADKTITVYNPTGQLLIDTNYDGIYESGITEFSSFEIRFRLGAASPLPAGSGTFKFRAFLAGTFTFTHKNLVDSGNSKSTFRILATCVPKDSDLDGTPDQLDLDSDNDGIPDLYESQASYNPLTGEDDNGDGIDNVFTIGMAIADMDNDGVPNYLDLDADNNGIYDLTESGANPTDANNNGVLDGNPAAFGSNGFSNALEIGADSGSLAFAVANTDGDNSFNFADADNDNDDCSDVLEAGYSDANGDGFLGSGNPVLVNINGIVTGPPNGYSVPNPLFNIATPIIIETQPSNFVSCELQNAVFLIVTNAGVNYQWQVSVDGVNFANISNNSVYSGATTDSLTITGLTPAMDGNIYKVLMGISGNVCGKISNQAMLTVNPLPDTVVRTLVQCDTGNAPDGITIFNLSEADTSFTNNDPNITLSYYASLFDAQNNGLPLDNDYTNTANPQQLTVKLTNTTSGCFSYSTLNLSVNLLPNVTTAVPPQCDTDGNEDGFFNFDLTTAPLLPATDIRFYESVTDALLEQNEIADPTDYVNTVPYAAETVYARIENGNDCARLYLINIKVNQLPQIDVNADLQPHVVCVNTPTFSTILEPAILDGSDAGDYNYQWYFEGVAIPGATASTLTVTAEGLYSVDVTNVNGCSKTRFIPVVSSSVAIIEDIAVTDLSEFNTISVTLTPNSYGNYVYSLDYENAFQSSNTFNNVSAGFHTVFVKDLNGCPTASEIVAVLGIPPYFTPNGDGYNDTWNVKGVNSRFNPNTEIRIFDRYGKLIKQIGAAGTGWNGTYNGNPMPSDDYWFVVTFENGETYKGHFALKR
jgi:gliding motility-associated-like protein